MIKKFSSGMFDMFPCRRRRGGKCAKLDRKTLLLASSSQSARAMLITSPRHAIFGVEDIMFEARGRLRGRFIETSEDMFVHLIYTSEIIFCFIKHNSAGELTTMEKQKQRKDNHRVVHLNLDISPAIASTSRARLGVESTKTHQFHVAVKANAIQHRLDCFQFRSLILISFFRLLLAVIVKASETWKLM
jgi:hypothetical protein